MRLLFIPGRLNIINARLKGLKSGKVDEDAEFEDKEALEGKQRTTMPLILLNELLSFISHSRGCAAYG
jgi:hypothetical protein